MTDPIYDQDCCSPPTVWEQNDYNQIFAQNFDTGYTLNNITSVTVYLKAYSSPTMNVTMALYASGDLPDNPTETSTTTVNGSSLDNSYAETSFTFTGNTTLSGDDIKIGLVFSAVDTSDYIQVAYSTATLADRNTQRKPDDGSNEWESQRAQSFRMQVYGGSTTTSTLLPPPIAWVNV